MIIVAEVVITYCGSKGGTNGPNTMRCAGNRTERLPPRRRLSVEDRAFPPDLVGFLEISAQKKYSICTNSPDTATPRAYGVRMCTVHLRARNESSSE